MHLTLSRKKESDNPPSGMPGVSTLLPVLLTLAADGRIPYEGIPKVTSRGPAQMYGLPERGYLRVDGRSITRCRFSR